MEVLVMNKWLILVAVTVIPLLFLAFVFTGCGKVVEEGGTTTTTTTTTSTSGTTTTTSYSATSSTILAIRYPTDNTTANSNAASTPQYLSTISLVGWDGSATNESFIKFDVSSIPLLTDIQSANLKLYINSVSYNPLEISTMKIYLYNVNMNWYENTLTWNYKPATIGTVVASKELNILSLPADSWLSIDVKDTVQGWVNTSIPNNGLVMLTMDSSHLNIFSYNSKANTSNRPKLEISY